MLLAVDTALGACSVALVDGDNIRAHIFEAMDRGHAERLAPMVEEAMRGVTFSSLQRLAVTIGPGTFTGQRVGLAFMRGLRLALKIPLIGVTTLEAMAASAIGETGIFRLSATEPRKQAAAIHDARRGEAYLSLLAGDHLVLDPVVMPFAEAVECIRAFGPCMLAGTGAPRAATVLGPEFSLTDIRQPDALWVARLVRTRPAPQDVPGPLYLRPPDAKLPGSKALV